MRILVTGGAGFIGGNLVHYLLALGGQVMVVDDMSTGSVANLDPRAEFRRLDIRDAALVEAAEQFAPDTIVHLAAQSSIGVAEKDPDLTVAVNVDGTLRVTEAAKACKVERVVFASSAAVYGAAERLPSRETDLTDPQNIYGQTKRDGELLIRDQLEGSGVDWALLRFSNVYGPRQNAHGEGGVVALFCDALAHGRVPTVYGDGQQTRDFIYVADVVQALAWCIGGEIDFGTYGQPATAATSDDRGIYNISTGEPTSIEQLINYLRVPTAFGQAVKHEPARPGDIEHSVLDPTKAFETFEWKAGIELTKGLDATWLWFSRPKH